jgi:hypothetical protein
MAPTAMQAHAGPAGIFCPHRLPAGLNRTAGRMAVVSCELPVSSDCIPFRKAVRFRVSQAAQAPSGAPAPQHWTFPSALYGVWIKSRESNQPPNHYRPKDS